MSLAPGTRLGPYEVVSPLGAGGMGEVYRARDTKLDRAVALKALPDTLAQDAERLARVVREAKTLAALNHPHIAQIHGLDESTGTPVLVMELVEGPTLAERIAEGPVSLEEALPIARQIADALEAAHDLGIVHRDLKPANVKVRSDGTVKVLDFGLAKPVAGPGDARASETLAHSPTVTSPAMTLQGVILGTAAYMSPEQAKGRPVDRRADIWAFGCVLYEMLTGQRAFTGEDVSDTLAAVLRGDVAWERLPVTTPAPVRTLLARCLERDVRKRLPHIGVARLELSEGTARETTSTPTPSSKSRTSWRVHAAWAAAVATVAAGVALIPRTAQPRASGPSVQFDVALPEGLAFPGANGVPRFAISRDGSTLVFAATEVGKRDQLYVRRLDDSEARPIRGTESPALGGDAVQQPFFSSDGQHVAFFSGAESLLKRVPIEGGTPQRVASLPTQNCAGSWHDEVILVASQGTRGVWRVSAEGGEPTPVTKLDEQRNEIAHLWPQFLPDGRRFIYLARTSSESGIYLASLDGGPSRLLAQSDAMARFAPPDQLLFVRDTTLMRQTVDLASATLVGAASVVLDRPLLAANTRIGVAASDTGTLVVATGPDAGGLYEIRLFDRSGRDVSSGAVESPVAEPTVRFAPDGRRIAFVKRVGAFAVWIKDLERAISSRVSNSSGADRLPVWSSDGTRVIYQSNRDAGGRLGLYSRDASGLSPEVLLHLDTRGHQVIPDDVSVDGRFLLYRDLSNSSVDLWLLPLSGDSTPLPYLRDGYRNRQASFSPDGRWVAYGSNEGGAFQQVFLRSFPDPALGKVQVSGDGASAPRWRRDGRELYYVNGQGRLMAVPISGLDNPVPTIGAPVELFRVGVFDGSLGATVNSTFDVSPDGQRFIVVMPRPDAPGVRLVVTLNWAPGLGR